ncbi:MAG TPA: hypothetical protein VE130_12805 [Nitrososphaeraceae archaeon]|nr:hypothetical protein [Nitrososphaeraceae archaeon]
MKTKSVQLRNQFRDKIRKLTKHNVGIIGDENELNGIGELKMVFYSINSTLNGFNIDED